MADPLRNGTIERDVEQAEELVAFHSKEFVSDICPASCGKLAWIEMVQAHDELLSGRHKNIGVTLSEM
ncbi:uncharacterized protein A4U43_C08F16680 [Asparagus officinalis]|nr:uncharacterized protein A4U43_C08F16680 [Asparagus officinalis]